MPTTRRQSKAGLTTKAHPAHAKAGRKRGVKKISKNTDKEGADAAEKHNGERAEEDLDKKQDEPAAKRQKVEEGETKRVTNVYKPGVIERGHIYFFYRPRVQVEEAHSIDEVRNMHMLLVPRSPEFASAMKSAEESTGPRAGADAVPAPPRSGESKQKYRLITIGKKHLPDTDQPGRREVFWATVTAIGDNLEELHSGLGPKTYETKTRGTRHEAANRLAGRGAYAIANTEARTPSQRETHLGYYLSHPPPSEMGNVQKELGISTASSFVVQVKNPLAPATGPQPVRSKGAEYPHWLMQSVFGAPAEDGSGPARGREEYGLRFASCETIELLDHLNAQLLMVAARSGEGGLEQSLGEGRGEALAKAEDKEGEENINFIFKELGADVERYPTEPLEGKWI